jgi:hypothetical protein
MKNLNQKDMIYLINIINFRKIYVPRINQKMELILYSLIEITIFSPSMKLYVKRIAIIHHIHQIQTLLNVHAK